MAKMKIKNKVAYYSTYSYAKEILDILKDDYPNETVNSRIVQYELGYAIQLFKSGPYFNGHSFN